MFVRSTSISSKKVSGGKKMANRDKTGPNGNGPKTGRKKGPC